MRLIILCAVILGIASVFALFCGHSWLTPTADDHVVRQENAVEQQYIAGLPPVESSAKSSDRPTQIERVRRSVSFQDVMSWIKREEWDIAQSYSREAVFEQGTAHVRRSVRSALITANRHEVAGKTNMARRLRFRPEKHALDQNALESGRFVVLERSENPIERVVELSDRFKPAGFTYVGNVLSEGRVLSLVTFLEPAGYSSYISKIAETIR